MNRHVTSPHRMSFDEFVAFVDTRPDEEKWELLEGHAVMSPTPVAPHQIIVKNLVFHFETLERQAPRPWSVLPGLSVHVPEVPASVPQPDVLIVRDVGNEGWFKAEPLVVFEILSPSTRRRDLTVKRDIYSRMPTISDYVMIAPKKREVTVLSRRAGWSPVVLRQPDDAVPLPNLGLVLPLAAIYHGLLR